MKSSLIDSVFVHRNQVQNTQFLFLKIAPKGLIFSSLNLSPKDSFFVHETQAQRTRFLFNHVTQNSNMGISFTLPHTSQQITYTPLVLIESTLQTHTGPQLSLSLKPRAAPLRVSNPHWSSQHSHSNPNTSPHSHSNLVPHHSESQTHTVLTTYHSHSNPHRSSQSLTLQT